MRARLLNGAFGLLYGRLAALHEFSGWLAFGQSWHARRLLLAPASPNDGLVLDLGCGEGRLLSDPCWSGRRSLGIDPSPQAARRAARRGVAVLRASSQRLPLPDGSVAAIVCSYPGPWILDARTWAEIARVTTAGATVSVLFGGTYEQGRFARLRGLLHRAAYGGRSPSNEPALPAEFGHVSVPGAITRVADAWGVAAVWRGSRVNSA